MKLLIPCYSDAIVPGLVTAAKSGIPMTVIANPWSGPGAIRIGAWGKAITQLADAGAQVLGYIDAIQWPGDGPGGKVKAKKNKSAGQINLESQHYREWYGSGNLAGWFIDDAVAGTDAAVSAAARMMPGLIMANPGSLRPRVSGVTAQVDWEDINYTAKPRRSSGANSAVMALACKNWQRAAEQAAAEGHSYFWAHELADDWTAKKTAYNTLPKFWGAMSAAFKHFPES